MQSPEFEMIREQPQPRDAIAVVVLTYNRLHLLRHCVENALLRTSPKTTEILLWDNASTDGTPEYLDSLDDPRITVVHHAENIGQNAYALAFRRTTAPYMIELDDDIIDAPQDWDATLLDAFLRLPRIGFLAANLVDNPHDTTAQVMYHRNASAYRVVEENGIRLKVGPTGGGCTITSRELHDRVGGFKQNKKHTFWLEDAAYIADIEKIGFGAAYLDDLKVLHAGGPYYAITTPEKARYWREYRQRVQRKQAVKRALLRVPLVRPLNERFGWFRVPASSQQETQR
jgi:GT2 family glycosyltransferase